MNPILSVGLAAVLAACLPLAAGAAPEAAPKRTLARFESETELRQWLEQVRKRREPGRRAKAFMADSAVQAPTAPPAPAAALAAGSVKAEESVTNVQTAGVDEGGIDRKSVV